MPLSISSWPGRYEVVAPIGAGGMGEVYRARDTRLHREVALKVLPSAFSEDSARMARFEREAQLLASLNHPNIAAIYGLEESGSTRALVMELVEGPTLAERIGRSSTSATRKIPSASPAQSAAASSGSRGSAPSGGTVSRGHRAAIALDEALPIAQQVAEALEYAHEHGVVHRDLKPANIKVTPDGCVKVLDFGLAKAMAPEEGSADLVNSPTLSLAMTEAGIILGTAAYMSPEQARGKQVDRRADIWAFGCVLFEMLSGQKTFECETVSDVLASVIKSEPDLEALPEDIFFSQNLVVFTASPIRVVHPRWRLLRMQHATRADSPCPNFSRTAATSWWRCGETPASPGSRWPRWIRARSSTSGRQVPTPTMPRPVTFSTWIKARDLRYAF